MNITLASFTVLNQISGLKLVIKFLFLLQTVMNSGPDLHDTSIIKSSYLGTPTQTVMQQSFSDRGNLSRNTPIRPLTAAYKAAASDHEVQTS